jgi:leucyl-tRNA synthetase
MNLVEFLKFNVAIAHLMKLTNTLETYAIDVGFTADYRNSLQSLIIMMSPITPHIAAELWCMLQLVHHEPHVVSNVFDQSWPMNDEGLLIPKTRDIMVQLNGRFRGIVNAPITSLNSETAIQQWVEQSSLYQQLSREISHQGHVVTRVIVARGHVINWVTQPITTTPLSQSHQPHISIS